MFNFDAVQKRTRGYLPHWEMESGRYHVVFRVSDSLPRAVFDRIKSDESLQYIRLVRRGVPRPDAMVRAAAVAQRRIDRYLDRSEGSCPLRNREVARIVADALEFFDRERYWLFDWSIMPNHVHVVFQAGRESLARVVHSWKSFTGLKANRILGRTGRFWQKEPWDRLIRNDQELIRTVRYVARNPERAGLIDWEWSKVYHDRLPPVSVL